MVMFGPPLFPSGEYTSSGEEALKLTPDAHFPGSVEIHEGYTALGPPPGLIGQENMEWELVGHDRIR
jgi:hypothetical protein